MAVTPMPWQAMYFEARGKFDRAVELHDDVLGENPDNMTMLKRQAS